MDLSRRSFLQGIGLGGIALSLPKPLGVVAATMKDLSDPPISAGYARFICPPGFFIYSITMSSALNVPATVNVYCRKIALDKLVMMNTPGHPSGMEYVVPSPLTFYESFPIEFWAVADGGRKPISGEMGISVTVFPSRVTNLERVWKTYSARIDHVRLERTRAIELGLIDPSEPEVEDTPETGVLAVST